MWLHPRRKTEAVGSSPDLVDVDVPLQRPLQASKIQLRRPWLATLPLPTFRQGYAIYPLLLQCSWILEAHPRLRSLTT